MLLLAGDLTRHGTVDEARCVATEFGGLDVPVVAVLGNHDYHCDQVPQVVRVLEDAGITVLEGDGRRARLHRHAGSASPGSRASAAGSPGACASEFGEPEMKAFVRTTSGIAEQLGSALRDLDCDVRVALTHYAPVPDTLVGEPLEIYPFLGSYLLGQAIDSAPTGAGRARARARRHRARPDARRGPGPQRRAPGDQAGVQRLPPH